MNNLINSGEEAFANFDSFFNMLTQESNLIIELTVISSEYNGSPIIEICIDGEKIKSQILSEGKHNLEIIHPASKRKSTHIEISMVGKLPKDTLVVDGNIVKDKYILIEKLMINNFDITTDFDLFYSKLSYTDSQGVLEPVKNGFWHNSTLHIKYDLPFITWYQKNTNKNIELVENLEFRDDKELAELQYQKLVNKLHLLK